jgi:hypothetical protein
VNKRIAKKIAERYWLLRWDARDLQRCRRGERPSYTMRQVRAAYRRMRVCFTFPRPPGWRNPAYMHKVHGISRKWSPRRLVYRKVRVRADLAATLKPR